MRQRAKVGLIKLSSHGFVGQMSQSCFRLLQDFIRDSCQNQITEIGISSTCNTCSRALMARATVTAKWNTG